MQNLKSVATLLALQMMVKDLGKHAGCDLAEWLPRASAVRVAEV